MFSIKKTSTFQVFYYFTHPDAGKISEKINPDSRRLHSDFLQKITNIHADELIDSNESLEQELSKYGIENLRDFFVTYPSAWYDLKRKIHAHKTIHGVNVYIAKPDEEHILGIFLRLKGIQKAHVEKDIRNEIFDNPLLLNGASLEPSVLDCSHGEIINIRGDKNRRNFIQRIIEYGIRINSGKAFNSGEYNTKFSIILERVIFYLKSIFGITFENLPNRLTPGSLAGYIVNEIWNSNGGGMRAKKAWMLAKSFTAWGSIPEILSVRKNGEEAIPDILKKLESLGISLKKTGLKTEEVKSGGESISISTGEVETVLQNGETFTCTFEYRIKSIRSILLKMWESEEYNTVDAMRDIIGFAIVWPENTPESTKIEVISKFAGLMSDKSFMLKNKDMLSELGLGQLRDNLSQKGINPLGRVAFHKKAKSSKGFSNTSISGFSETSEGVFTGLEVQFFDENKHKFWKTDHYTFDPLKIISAWSRGSWFMTPQQIIYCIQREIPENIRNDLLRKRPQEIFYDYLKEGILVAYTGKNDNDVYIVPRNQEQRFREKFKSGSIRKVRIGGSGNSKISDSIEEQKALEERRNSDKFKEFIGNLRTYDSSTF